MIDNHMFQFVNLLTAVLAMNVIVTIIMVPNLLRHGATTKKWDWHSDSIKSNQTQARMGSAFTSDQILASRHILYDIYRLAKLDFAWSTSLFLSHFLLLASPIFCASRWCDLKCNVSIVSLFQTSHFSITIAFSLWNAVSATFSIRWIL